MIKNIIIFVLAGCLGSFAFGASSEADQYFTKRKQSAKVQARKRQPASAAPHYLAIHVGQFIEDEAHVWGEGNKQQDVGAMLIGVTYRMGEWVNSTDLSLRMDFNRYELDLGVSTKMSILALATFPDAKSTFPLYFGAGIGPGIFFKQVDEESSLSLDYQLVAGARFYNILDSIGLVIEFGQKNHVHLLSDGQFSGVYLAAGTVFVF